MSPKIFALVLSFLSTGSSVCYLTDTAETRPEKAVASALATRLTWEAPNFVGASLGAGTVESSRSYNLVAQTGGRIRTIFVQPGQHVRRGDVLVKLDPIAYVVVPTDGVVTSYLVQTGDYQRRTAPVARFTQLAPFRIRLAQSANRLLLVPGQFVQVQSAQDSGQGITATVVGSTVAGQSLLVDLRVRTASSEPLLAGAPVVVDALLLTP